MATWPSNQTPDQWLAAGAVPSPPTHDTTTTAAYDPSTVASRVAAEFDATAPTSARLPYLTNLAWSAAARVRITAPNRAEATLVHAFRCAGLRRRWSRGCRGSRPLRSAARRTQRFGRHEQPQCTFTCACGSTDKSGVNACDPDEAGHADPLGDGKARILWFHQPSDNAPTLDVVFIGAARQ